MEEYKVARAFRDSRIGTIGGGSSEIMREIIAKMVIDDVNYSRQTTDHSPQQEEEMTVDKIFSTLPSRFKKEKATEKNLNVLFKFDTKNYLVEIKNGELSIQETVDSGLSTVDCTVETDDETYINVETGKMNPQEAFMTGKIKVSDLMQMMAFGGLFKKL